MRSPFIFQIINYLRSGATILETSPKISGKRLRPKIASHSCPERAASEKALPRAGKANSGTIRRIVTTTAHTIRGFLKKPVFQMEAFSDLQLKARNSSPQMMVRKAMVRATCRLPRVVKPMRKAIRTEKARTKAWKKIMPQAELFKRGSLGSRGFCFMISFSPCSTPSASAGRASVTRFIQRRCTGPRGMGRKKALR